MSAPAASSAAARATGPGRWLAGHFSVCLAAYDTRRGQAEGQEADKVLGFYPPTAPPAMQSSIVGLAQAVTMFAGTFNKVRLVGRFIDLQRAVVASSAAARRGAAQLVFARRSSLRARCSPRFRFKYALQIQIQSHLHLHIHIQDCPVHTMETDNNLWAMVNCEPGVWLLMVSQTGGLSG
jgi:hypothetical protein